MPARDPAPRGSEAWRISRLAADHQVEAFTTHASGLPGTRVGLKVSTTEGGYEAAAYRIGAYRGGTGAFVWESGFRRGQRQASPVLDPVETRTVVAPWKRDLTVDTSTWQPGFYVFTLRTPTGWQTQVPYVVTSPTAKGPSPWWLRSRRGRPTTGGAGTASTRGPSATAAATR